MKKLGDAELEIMKILWRHNQPVTSGEILNELAEYKSWKLASLMTALNRLADKGFVHCDRSTRTNYYTAVISGQDYAARVGQNFLEKLFSNSIRNFVTNLYDSKSITDEDLKELREWMDSLEKEKK